MNINKKLDRMRQWGKERMGGEVRTDTTDDFKMLETEMQLRHEGLDRINKASNTYIKTLSKRDQYEGREKQMPVAYFGNSLVAHGDDFEPDSEFGQCLSSLGRANERIARMQETYVANATSSWLESLERSLVQMQEYQTARKKLDTRRLAFDTSQAKMQKSKKEDFRMEEELRSQKAKYEESNEDVYRRMQDIKEAEADSVQDLTSFLEAELSYYDRCREVLLQVKKEWPTPAAAANNNRSESPGNGFGRRPTRSRSNTATSLGDRFNRIVEEEPLEPPVRPSSRIPSGQSSPRREMPGFDLPARPHANSRTNSGFEGPTSLRDGSPGDMPRLSRVPTEPGHIQGARSNLRSISTQRQMSGDVFGDDGESVTSETPSSYLEPHRQPSFGAAAMESGKKAAPPPPPSRSKKPPPPPPLKRSALSTSELPRG